MEEDVVERGEEVTALAGGELVAVGVVVVVEEVLLVVVVLPPVVVAVAAPIMELKPWLWCEAAIAPRPQVKPLVREGVEAAALLAQLL